MKIWQLSMGIVLLLLVAVAPLLGGQQVAAQAQCGDVQTAFDFNCPDNVDSKSSDPARNPIFAVLIFGINLLAGGVGVMVVITIIWGAIKYAGADGHADRAQSGKDLIMNAVIGLLLFIAMYAVINFLVPGGLLN